MHSATLLLATFSILASAHSDPRDVHAGLPKLVGGGKFMANLKARNMFNNPAPMPVEGRAVSKPNLLLEARVTQTCGAGVGNCDAGYCCSASGYCGTASDYCAAPDCQFLYGPACDANKKPAGASTSAIARPKIGSVPYGGINTAGVQDCIELGVISFTFDDGPYLYTKDLLDLLDSYGAKATFFITGNNLGKGEIDDCATGYPQLIKRMYNSGHQVASHTWSHQDLSTLSTTDFNNQMYYNEMAFRNILGVIPTYMRPPYSSCGSTCSTTLAKMGYHVTYFDLDTEGYLNDDPNLIQNSKNIFSQALASANPTNDDFLLIEHDIHYQTVYNLTRYMLDTMRTAGWGAPVTVGQCLGDPQANWYRAAGTAIATCAAGTFTGTVAPAASTVASASKTVASSSGTTKPTTTVSKDGSCGGSITCQGSTYGNCCSQYGYCGKTSVYCGTGCKPSFGTCSSSAAASSSTAIPVSDEGSCGSTGKNETCKGSTFGNCCSQYGYCGSTTAYCGTGCQAGFGTCS